MVKVEAVVVSGDVYTGWTPSPRYTYQPQPISVVGATALDSSSLSIDTTGLLGGATTLQLEAAGSGSTYVSQVVLYDANGDYRVVNLNTMISPANPSVQIALGDDAGVVRIVVDGHSTWGGAIAIQAQ